MLDLLNKAKKLNLFDCEWYSKQHRMTFKSEIEAFQDCLRRSVFTDISPSPSFDTLSYYENYPDIFNGSLSPLEHYLTFGIDEGRSKFPLRPLWTPKNRVIGTSDIEIIKRKKIAIAIHIHYEDFVDIFCSKLKELDFQFDLLITANNPNLDLVIQDQLKYCTNVGQIIFRHVNNHGRHFGPLLVEFGKMLLNYDFFCHLHSKKSIFSGNVQERWSSYLIEYLIGNKQVVNEALSVMCSSDMYGMYYPTTFWNLPGWSNSWLKNKGQGRSYLQNEFSITNQSEFFSYPVGGMFWAKSSALKDLLDRDWTYDDFPSEPVPPDGTFLHVVERILPFISQNSNYESLYYYPPSGTFTSDDSYIFFSYSFGYQKFKNVVSKYQIVSFDVFDTVARRKYYEPDYAKYILPSKFNLKVSSNEFVALRNEIELNIRKERNFVGDVNIFEIYERLVNFLDYDGNFRDLAEAEFNIDLDLIEPKQIMVNLVNYLSLNKEIFFITDTYYTSEQILRLLNKIGIVCDFKLFVSSDLSLRKDNGSIWHFISDELDSCSLNRSFIHVGDNACSDCQIPGDIGLSTFHILSPLDKWIADGFDKSVPQIFSLSTPDTIKVWGPLIAQIGSNPFLK